MTDKQLLVPSIQQRRAAVTGHLRSFCLFCCPSSVCTVFWQPISLLHGLPFIPLHHERCHKSGFAALVDGTHVWLQLPFHVRPS